jgi:putative membrane protein
MMNGWMHGFGGMGLIGGIIGLLFNLVVVVGIVVLVVWAVKRFSNGTSFNLGPGSQTPREILQARYARGELTREQYQQMLQDLNS